MRAAETLRTVCAIAQVPGLSPGSVSLAFAILRETGQYLHTIYQLSDAQLSQRFAWDAAQVRAFRTARETPLDQFERYARRGIGVTTLLDEVVPERLNHLHATPWLFFGGNLTLLDHSTIGFSGSRDASDRALEISRGIAVGAVRQGMVVVSGGARGVDMAAHSAALEAGGSTIVLVPQGIDTWRAPSPLVDPAVMDNLLVMTTDVPWAPWTTVSAMQRNRAIVDLADVITIPEAGVTGGSHSTGLYALGQKRDLWVADLGDDAPGNHILFRRGASTVPITEGEPDVNHMRTPKPAAVSQQSLF